MDNSDIEKNENEENELCIVCGKVEPNDHKAETCVTTGCHAYHSTIFTM